MKKILTSLFTCIALASFGQPEILPPLVCSGVTTSTTPVTATSQTLSAYVDCFRIAVSPAATTCTVTIASAAETLYTATGVTGSSIVRPVVYGSVNGSNVEHFAKAFIASDAITVSAKTATTVTNITVTVVPVIERQP